MNKTVDLVNGDIKKSLIRFAFPMFIGQLFQQMYNLADAIVVGNFVGEEALAAVTNTGSLIFLLVGFFSGMFTGASVVISRYFGEGSPNRVKLSVSTSVVFGFFSGIVFTIIGVLTTPTILRFMGTPDNVYTDSAVYIRTYFMGIIFVILYNTACGIFQAVGDSKRPLYYLIISSVLNIALDLLLVGALGLGVRGAAIATVLSQATSTVLAFSRLARLNSIYRVNFRELYVDKEILMQVINIGLPSGVQNSVIAFANIVVQSSINSFGSTAMAGNGAYSKVEGFVFIPITAFSMAITIFVSQNIGARRFERVRKGAKFGIIFSCIIAQSIGLIFYLFSTFFIGLFGDSAEVIAMGVSRAAVDAPFYFLLSFSHCIAGVMRGAGRSKIPMAVMLLSWCVIRCIYIQFVTLTFHDINLVFWAYPLTWSISSIIFLLYYLKSDWLTKHIKVAS